VLAAQTAVAQLRNDWNRRAGNTVDAIPREIWSSVLILLPLRDRVAVMRVSCSLHEIATSDHTLWSSGQINNVAALQFIRKRSGLVPLELQILALGDSESLLREICSDAERFKSLRFTIVGRLMSLHRYSASPQDGIEQFFQCRLPLLTEFCFYYSMGSNDMVLPAIALPIDLAVLAPQLRTLTISVVVTIPENIQPLPQMSHFAVVLSATDTRKQLFAMLPNVQ